MIKCKGSIASLYLPDRETLEIQLQNLSLNIAITKHLFQSEIPPHSSSDWLGDYIGWFSYWVGGH